VYYRLKGLRWSKQVGLMMHVSADLLMNMRHEIAVEKVMFWRSNCILV